MRAGGSQGLEWAATSPGVHLESPHHLGERAEGEHRQHDARGFVLQSRIPDAPQVLVLSAGDEDDHLPAQGGRPDPLEHMVPHEAHGRSEAPAPGGAGGREAAEAAQQRGPTPRLPGAQQVGWGTRVGQHGHPGPRRAARRGDLQVPEQQGQQVLHAGEEGGGHRG